MRGINMQVMGGYRFGQFFLIFKLGTPNESIRL